MSETNKDQQPVAPALGFGDRTAVEQRGRAIRNIHPLPGTPEAKALGCTCGVAGVGSDGKPLFAMTKGCPVRNHG